MPAYILKVLAPAAQSFIRHSHATLPSAACSPIDSLFTQDPKFPPVNSSTSFAACGERLADIDATHVVKSNPNASGDLIPPVENKYDASYQITGGRIMHT